MNGKENIINKILSDADARCAQILSDAEEVAQSTLRSARQDVEQNAAAMDKRIAAMRDERIRNALVNAEMDAKKYRLQSKQQLVEKCYNEVYKRLAAMNGDDRLDLIGELLTKYAEDGETVYVTSADAKNVTQLWLDGFDKRLKLASKHIRADGGVVLEGDGYEKDLTLSRLVRYLKEQTESDVAERLGVRNEQ